MPILSLRQDNPEVPGDDPARPALIGQALTTGPWRVEPLEALRGAAVLDRYPEDDRRVRNLADSDPEGVAAWFALRTRVANASTDDAYLPPTSLVPVAADGTEIPDVLTLTPPDPDLAGPLAAGEARVGWAAFTPPTGFDPATPLVLRFLPYRTDPEPRFLSLESEPGPEPGVGAAEFAPDDRVRVIDAANLREAPSTEGAVVAVLPAGTDLVVTGAPIAGGGRDWYPVADPATGNTGYVAAEVLGAGG